MERMAATSRADLLVDVFGNHVVIRAQEPAHDAVDERAEARFQS
jgi:hypothetical protein